MHRRSSSEREDKSMHTFIHVHILGLEISIAILGNMYKDPDKT